MRGSQGVLSSVLSVLVLVTMAGIFVTMPQLVSAVAQTETNNADDLKKPVALKSVSDTENAVLSSVLPWVVRFVPGEADAAALEAVSELATKLDAIARVGVVSTSSSSDVVDSLGGADVAENSDDSSSWRVYPYGDEDKVSRATTHENGDVAGETAVASVPADVVTLIDESVGTYEPFVVDSVQKGKLSAIFFTGKPGVPALATKLALWLKEDFAIAVYANAPEEVTKASGVTRIPNLICMVPQLAPADDEKNDPTGGGGGGPGQQQVRLGVALYDRKQFGGLKFKNIVRYLLTVKHQLQQSGVLEKIFPGKGRQSAGSGGGGGGGAGSKNRKKNSLPPPPPAPPAKPLFEATADTPDFCSAGKLGLCIVGIIDAHPRNADNKEAQIKALATAQKLPSLQGRALHFSWIDASCHPGVLETLGVSPDAAPTVVAISPKKMSQTSLVGAYTAESIGSFVNGVLGGRQRMFPVQSLPVVPESDDCTAAHAPEEVYEEEVDLDDIMSEILEEEAAAKEAQEEAAADLLSAEEQEMEAKRRRAMEEAERLNKKSSKKNKNKKKKKKSKKKKGKKAAKKKDEL